MFSLAHYMTSGSGNQVSQGYSFVHDPRNCRQLQNVAGQSLTAHWMDQRCMWYFVRTYKQLLKRLKTVGDVWLKMAFPSQMTLLGPGIFPFHLIEQWQCQSISSCLFAPSYCGRGDSPDSKDREFYSDSCSF